MGKIYYLSDNTYYDWDNQKLYVCGNEKELSFERRLLLEELIINSEITISADRLAEKIYVHFKDIEDPEKAVQAKVRRLRKDLKDDGTILKTVRGSGIKLQVIKVEDVSESIEVSNDLPIFFTKHIVPYASDKTVLFRSSIEKYIESAMNEDINNAVLLHGGGGVGKTSLARLVYHGIKDRYEATGWVDYNGNFKSSIVSQANIAVPMAISESKKENAEWDYISGIIGNSKKRKLLIIDNVDIDLRSDQNPKRPEEVQVLREITGWNNTDIIMTSRIPDISGYRGIPVKNLKESSEENGIEDCIDLFFHYCPDVSISKRRNREIVKKIVELCGYNTMVIELVAKSYINMSSLENYYEKLCANGFNYSDVPITTLHDLDEDTTGNQLMKLFEIGKRSDVERMALWDIHALPEGEKITKEELISWLGYQPSEISNLVKEKWIDRNDDIFSMHPLIRQAVRTTESEWDKYLKLTTERRKNDGIVSIIEIAQTGKLFKKDNDTKKALRGIQFLDALSCSYKRMPNEIIFQCADYCRKNGLREYPLKCYKLLYERIHDEISRRESMFEADKHTNDYNDGDSRTLIEGCWKATYFTGYMLSYELYNFEKAEVYLEEACKIAESVCEINNRNERSIYILAMSYDHLGYIISRSHDHDIDRLLEADMYLKLAIAYREKLNRQNPESMKYKHDLAWSYDNIGYFYATLNADEIHINESNQKNESKVDELIKESHQAGDFLEKALAIRIDIEKDDITGVSAEGRTSEVAWTYYNLGLLMANDKSSWDKAEDYYNKAIEIYKELDLKYTWRRNDTLQRVYRSYAELMEKQNRIKEKEEFLNLAERVKH